MFYTKIKSSKRVIRDYSRFCEKKFLNDLSRIDRDVFAFDNAKHLIYKIGKLQNFGIYKINKYITGL